MAPLDNVVVVGASLAGLRAVETLRQDGYDGRVVLVGAEQHLPYDRPPLSKQLLAGTADVEQVMLRPAADYDTLDLDLRLGTVATALDPASREVELAGSERIGYQTLLIATGAAPRFLPGTPPLEGIHVLRTLDDCLALRGDVERAEASGGRIIVVGAGFIGAEVAATCHGRGVGVTVLEALPVPMVNALGVEMASVCAALHYDHGVDLRCGVAVSSFLGDGRVKGVVLDDGRRVDADVVVVGIGVAPATLPVGTTRCSVATCASSIGPTLPTRGWWRPRTSSPERAPPSRTRRSPISGRISTRRRSNAWATPGRATKCRSSTAPSRTVASSPSMAAPDVLWAHWRSAGRACS